MDEKTLRLMEHLRKVAAVVGEILLDIAGEKPATTEKNTAVVPQVVPQLKGSPDKRKFKRPQKEYTCIVCGVNFCASGPKPLVCPHCSILRQNKNPNFMAAYAAAKAKLAAGDKSSPTSPAPAVPEGKIRCERMHATIPASMCDTREECRGCSHADR